MALTLHQVDAFAEEPFTGNPAAVAVVDGWPESEWMQNLAQEMNLSETAFVCRDGDGWSLRWFTPEAEVDLCGHATLATAAVLWNDGHAPPDRPLRFSTRSGALIARRADAGLIELDFPATPPQELPAPVGLLEALGVTAPRVVGKSRFDAFVVVETEEEVTGAKPDFRALLEVETRGVILTAVSAREDTDFVSRFFAPQVGVAEDPVTGSAHCTLAPYWCARLGRERLTGYQASPRGGVVEVRWSGGDRVHLAGRAVFVFRASLLV